MVQGSRLLNQSTEKHVLILAVIIKCSTILQNIRFLFFYLKVANLRATRYVNSWFYTARHEVQQLRELLGTNVVGKLKVMIFLNITFDLGEKMLFLAYVKNSFSSFKLLTFLKYGIWSHAGNLSSITAVASQVKTTASLHMNRFPLLTSSFFPHIKNNIFFSSLKSFSYHWFSKYYDRISHFGIYFPFPSKLKNLYYFLFWGWGGSKWLDWELENWKLLVNSGLQFELSCESFLMFLKIHAIWRGYTEV